MQECPRGTMEESTWALDRFRVRRRCAVRVHRSHRRTLSTGALRSAKRLAQARFLLDTLKSLFSQFT